MVLSLIVNSMGVTLSSEITQAELLSALVSIAIPMLIITLLFSYVQPLVQANVVMANTFKEGFFAVMTLFSVDVWSKAMTKKYFKYTALFGTAVFGIMFIFALISGLLSAVPVVNILMSIVLLLGIYVFIVIMGVAAMMVKRIVE